MVRGSLKRTNIVVTGDSAGGQLTLSTGLAAEENGVILKGLAAVYPATQDSVQQDKVYQRCPDRTKKPYRSRFGLWSGYLLPDPKKIRNNRLKIGQVGLRPD